MQGWLEGGGEGQAKGGVTSYLDMLLHFELECTISGTGSQSEAMLVRLGAIDHLPSEIKVNGQRSIWSRAQKYREKSVEPGERETLIEEIHYHWRSQQA